jgi:hypothetical protein
VSQLFAVVIRNEKDFIDGAITSVQGKDGKYVGFSGGIGYNFGDFVQFGAATYDTVQKFEGVKTELPFAGLRIKDISGKCILAAAAPIPPAVELEVFSQEFESLRLGVNKLTSCKFEVTSRAELDS